ncbi:unnamed protein product [Cunninghamella blakesleeana]
MTLTYRNGPFYPTSSKSSTSIKYHPHSKRSSTKSSSHEFTMFYTLPELVQDDEEEEEEDPTMTPASPPSTPPLSSNLSMKRSATSFSSNSNSSSSSMINHPLNQMDASFRKRQKCIPRPSPHANTLDRVFQLPYIASSTSSSNTIILPTSTLSPSSPSSSSTTTATTSFISNHHLKNIIRDQQLQQELEEEENENHSDQPFIIYLNHHHHNSSSSPSSFFSPLPSPTSYLLKAMNESISSSNVSHLIKKYDYKMENASNGMTTLSMNNNNKPSISNKMKNEIILSTIPKTSPKSILKIHEVNLHPTSHKSIHASSTTSTLKSEKPHSTVFSSGRPIRTKGPCQACHENTEACMRKAFDWPFPSDEIYYDKGKPFVYLCNKCGLRYNKSGGSVCRNCRWVLCKEEKRKALQHIEEMKLSRLDGKIDLNEDIPSFICTPKYWHCGQPWKVEWILNNHKSPTSSSPSSNKNTTMTTSSTTTSCDTS